MILNNFFKKIFRKKTKEELQGKLQSLLNAQARDNEMIEKWAREFKENNASIEKFDEKYSNYLEEADIIADPAYYNLPCNIYHYMQED